MQGCLALRTSLFLVALACTAARGKADEAPPSADLSFVVSDDPVAPAALTDRTPRTASIQEDSAHRPSGPDARPQVPPPRCGCEACGCQQKTQCNRKRQSELNAAVAGAHKGLFYNNDFSYLEDRCYDDWWPGDRFKRNRFGSCWTWDIGGQYRMRLHNERHHRGLGLTGRNDDFLLHRTRLYGNLEFGDRFRAYAEYLDAESNYEDFAPRPIEVNRSDIQNLFGDLKVFQNDDGRLWLRAGRQELLYGAQRTISPLDWANTRRTFEGYKAFWKGTQWDVDAFYVRPIDPLPNQFDSPDHDREFMGVYAAYKGLENESLDLYYLAFNNERDPFKYDTWGARYSGSRGAWLWEFEGAYQSGSFRGADHDAGFWVVGLGRKMECAPWKPTVWIYYDWASGDDIQGNGFDHLFPLAHKYLGFMDLFGRRNIEDANLLVTAQPHEKLKLLLWYHYFNLENGNDVPYNVNMTPFNAANPPASEDLGHELDLLASWTINARMNLLFGYSHFFAGSYYKNTPGVPFRGDADFYYTQFTFNF